MNHKDKTQTDRATTPSIRIYNHGPIVHTFVNIKDFVLLHICSNQEQVYIFKLFLYIFTIFHQNTFITARNTHLWYNSHTDWCRAFIKLQHSTTCKTITFDNNSIESEDFLCVYRHKNLISSKHSCTHTYAHSIIQIRERGKETSTPQNMDY
jgi:hypothetical protein